MNTMQRKKKAKSATQRKMKTVIDKEQTDRAQCWLRERFRLGQPTVIQSNDEGFFFMFKDDRSLYFFTWTNMASDHVPDLTAAKVH